MDSKEKISYFYLIIKHSNIFSLIENHMSFTYFCTKRCFKHKIKTMKLMSQQTFVDGNELHFCEFYIITKYIGAGKTPYLILQ